MIYSLAHFRKNVYTTSLTTASRMVTLVLWIPKSSVYCWDPQMGYAIEGQSDILSAPVTSLLWDMQNGAQNALSPHICVPSTPFLLPFVQGTSADGEAQGRKQADRVLGMRVVHPCAWKLGKRHLGGLEGWISPYCVQWSFLDH